jgi:hypothetical protein
MVRAAAHRQVNYQSRGDEDAAQPGHRFPYLSPIFCRRYSLATFSRIALLPSEGMDPTDDSFTAL